MAIRVASLRDADALRQFGRQAFSDTYVGHPNSDADPEFQQEYMRRAYTLEQFESELQSDQNVFLIYEVENNKEGSSEGTVSGGEGHPKILGYAKVVIGAVEDELDWSSPSPTTGGRRSPIRLERLYVSKEAIGLRGIGTQLLEASKRVAVDHKCDLMWLGCWGGNTAAMAFYFKKNFRIVGKLYFQLGPERRVNELLQIELN